MHGLVSTPRLLVRRTAATADFGTSRFLGLSLLPAALVARLRPEPTGLYEVMWREAWEAGELDLVEHHGVAFGVGTPARLLAANLCAGEGRSFVHPSAHVAAPRGSSCVGLSPAPPTPACEPGGMTHSEGAGHEEVQASDDASASKLLMC